MISEPVNSCASCSCESSSALQWSQHTSKDSKSPPVIQPYLLTVNRFWPQTRSVRLRKRGDFEQYNQTLSMSAIFEDAKRTSMYDISGGGITSTFLWNGSADRQSVSDRIIGPNCLMPSCPQTEQSNHDSDQDNVRIVVPKFSSNTFIKWSRIAGRKAVNRSAD